MSLDLASIEKLVIENSLCATAVFAAVGFFLITVLVSILLTLGHKRKLKKALIRAQTEYNEKLEQAKNSAQIVQEKIQVLEENISVQCQQLADKEHVNKALLTELAQHKEQVSALTLLLQQRRQLVQQSWEQANQTEGITEDIASLTDNILFEKGMAKLAAFPAQLVIEKRRCLELEQIISSGQAMLAKQEVDLDTLTDRFNFVTAHDAELEQRLNAITQDYQTLQAQFHSYQINSEAAQKLTQAEVNQQALAPTVELPFVNEDRTVAQENSADASQLTAFPLSEELHNTSTQTISSEQLSVAITEPHAQQKHQPKDASNLSTYAAQTFIAKMTSAAQRESTLPTSPLTVPTENNPVNMLEDEVVTSPEHKQNELNQGRQLTLAEQAEPMLASLWQTVATSIASFSGTVKGNNARDEGVSMLEKADDLTQQLATQMKNLYAKLRIK